jgi:uncharacterized protein YwbE
MVPKSHRVIFITDAIRAKGVIENFLWESTSHPHNVTVR